MTPETLETRIVAGVAPFVLDVRSSREFARGRVPGAVHVPFWQVPRHRRRLREASHGELVVYCGHGPRAWMAGALLRATGCRVDYLHGHYAAWQRRGHREER